MKKLFLILIAALLIVPAISYAETIRLEWEHGNESDLAGFLLYQGDDDAANCPTGPVVADLEYTGDTNTFETEYQVVGESGQTFYFKVTAYDTSGNESACSNSAAYTLPDIIGPSAPFNLTIEVVVVPPSP